MDTTADTPIFDSQYAKPYAALAGPAFLLAFFVPILAIVAGHLALTDIKRQGHGGKSFAIFGTVFGYLSFVAHVTDVFAGGPIAQLFGLPSA